MIPGDILAVLRDYKTQFAEQYGILSLGIFGSAARNEMRPDSDVDIVVRLSEPELFALAGIKQDLEDRVHLPVDIVDYRETMNHFLKQRIDREAIYV